MDPVLTYSTLMINIFIYCCNESTDTNEVLFVKQLTRLFLAFQLYSGRFCPKQFMRYNQATKTETKILPYSPELPSTTRTMERW